MSDISSSDFDRLLKWFHPERDQAGRIYEEIRRKMTRFFTCRGCMDPDSLTDATMERVNSLIVREDFRFTGAPILFFYGVARNIYHEWLRQAVRPKPKASDLYPTPEASLTHTCLESCIEQLKPEQADLILSYYQYAPGGKVEHREEVAKRCGIATNALRIRVHRIREILRECIEQCMHSGGRLQ